MAPSDVRKAEGGKESVTCEVPGGTVARDAHSGAAGGVQAGERIAIDAEDACVAIDAEPSLGVEERRLNTDCSVRRR
jgi:hypothetical protein